MKATTISTILLATASTVIATPSGFTREVKRDAQPVRITDINAIVYAMSEPATHFVNFNFTNGVVSSHCQGSWSDSQGQHPDHCTDARYLVDFPKGFANIDDFTLRVYREDGSADAKGVVNGDKWECEDRNDQTPIKRTCKWVGGDFNLQ